MKFALCVLRLTYLVIGSQFAIAANDSTNEKVRVPVIDLTPWFDKPVVSSQDLTAKQRGIVREIRWACREVGFFQITGGLGGGGSSSSGSTNSNDGDDDEAVIQQAWKASREFFDLSTEEKLRHKTTDTTEYPYGYERSETLVRGKSLDGGDGATTIGCENNNDDDDDDDNEPCAPPGADLKETFALGPPTGNGSGMPPRRWIDSPGVSPAFRTYLEAYYAKMEGLALTLLEIFAIALEEPPGFFLDKMDHHMAALRLVHYYPLEKQQRHQQKDSEARSNDRSKDATPSSERQEEIPRIVRAGAHTDYGALTILAARDKGLEVLLRDTNNSTGSTTGDGDGSGTGDDEERGTTSSTTTSGRPRGPRRWHPVPLVQGAFVVNLGDLMQRWTNNEWISTMHRVVMPSTEARERRYSMAYFVNINGDTPIEPLGCCRGDGGALHNTNGRVITAGEHLMAKHLASMGIVAGDDARSNGTGDGEL